MHALTLSNVSHRFAGSWVLAHLDAKVEQGSQVLLTGDNGAGKTTLLRLMATALRPTRGALQVFGQNPADNLAAVRRRLALLTHQHYFYEALSGRTNLDLVVRLGSPRRRDVNAVLAEVGLLRAADLAVASYSAGMVRRLAFARLLLLGPELILLDEPFGQLDGSGVAFVEEFLARQAAAKTTWVISTHDTHRAQALCSHHLHLRAGQAQNAQFAGAWAAQQSRKTAFSAPAGAAP